jgi:hypothetical protein
MADDAPQLIEWLLQRCALVRHAVRNVRRTACDMQHVSMQEEMAVEYDIPLFPRKAIGPRSFKRRLHYTSRGGGADEVGGLCVCVGCLH